jgi:hypothetical protein
MGATFEDGILADFITAGTLYGILVKAGAIESADGRISINLNTNGGPAQFNTGIKTNKSIEVFDQTENFPMFVVKKIQSGTNEFLHITGYDGAYNVIFDVQNTENSQGLKASIMELRSTNNGFINFIASPSVSQIDMRSTGGSFNLESRTDGGYLQLPKDTYKKLSWKSNGDGTYTLIGQ